MKRYEFTKDQLKFIETMRQPFVVCQLMDRRVIALAVSDGFCRLFGYQNRTQAYADMNQNMYKDVHPDDAARFTSALLQFVTEGGSLGVIYRTRKKDGPGYMVIHLTGEHVYTEDGAHLAHIWYTEEGDYNDKAGPGLSGMLNRALHEGSIVKANRYDALTGLPSMSYFFELSENARQAMLARGGLPALLYIDLNGMKHYNHKFGFAEGDNLLKAFSTLLSNIFHTENCCHIGADRYAAITDENGLDALLDRLFSEWRQMNLRQHLPICVGIYPNRVEEVPVGVAYDRAKIACDALKGAYHSSFKVYSAALSDGLLKHQYVVENFDRALSENWIQVYYQPIMRAINARVCDEEALARWIDPEKGFLSPADFIPCLEDAGLIYRLDLYMLERVLEDIKVKQAEGFYIVPHSVNLSRSDFDACDMVEEIRRRVDAAGVSRDRISIEITESVIGSDFDFMKTQVERFQALGFPVWMDDFGSGYSSLDMLQSIKFNLLKFDMGFMRRLDESGGRIILTELMKMASALGVDTICEGVETEEQVHFLQEIGCSKLQGFYFSKPMPVHYALEYHRTHKLTGYENPAESAYYESICGLNLYDINVIAREEKDSLQNTYTTLPMGIIEVKGDSTRFVRTNQSYRDFFRRFFGLDLSSLGSDFVKYDAAFMHNVAKACCEQGIRTFYDEKMPDGSIVHAFARRIGVNPITGTVAIAIAVLSIREPNEKLLVEQILSVIEQFGEHMPGGFFIYKADETGALLYANKAVCNIFGCDSLEEFKALTGFTFRGMVHPDDYTRISASITDQVAHSQEDLDFVEYRIVRKDGRIRWIDDYGHYVEYDDNKSLYYVFISDITDKYEQAESDKALRSAVIEALTRPYDSVWLITDIQTQQFELYRVDEKMVHLMPAQAAAKITRYTDAFAFYSRLVLPEDRQRFLEAVAPENIIENTQNKLIYSVPFRRVFEDGIRRYRVEFARLDLGNGRVSIVTAFKDVDDETSSQ
ncbi:MAG: EAL domain-containing protein [Clostridia bacterium]|nr:EAL domain-containing protein [Clostridia bacterium]